MIRWLSGCSQFPASSHFPCFFLYLFTHSFIQYVLFKGQCVPSTLLSTRSDLVPTVCLQEADQEMIHRSRLIDLVMEPAQGTWGWGHTHRRRLSPSPPRGLQGEDPERGHPLGHPGKMFLRNWIEVRHQWNRDRGTFLMIEIIMSRGFEEGKVCVCARLHASVCL